MGLMSGRRVEMVTNARMQEEEKIYASTLPRDTG